MMEAWKKDAAGSIIMNPLVGYEILVSTSETPRVSIRLNFIQEGDAPAQPTGITQLIFSAQRALEIARALESAAQKARGDVDLSERQNLL